MARDSSFTKTKSYTCVFGVTPFTANALLPCLPESLDGNVAMRLLDIGVADIGFWSIGSAKKALGDGNTS